MDIRRLSMDEGARAAAGTAVIIDVFRAFTCEPLMLRCGARRILLQGDPAACLAYRADVEPDAVLVGEVDEMPIPGFDLTNSPWLILNRGRTLFAGRTVVHRTTSGVTGAITALRRCDEVLLASFVNARATVRHILARRPPLVSIVAMGIRSRAPAPEDEACGDWIESLLGGRPYDHVAALAAILAHETAQKFLRADKPHLPPEDVALCLQRDLSDVALRAEVRVGRVEAIPIQTPATTTKH
ncbi:MAG TPA: 2-phosphosulfolactate phosphatase [Rhodospirillales bacterium]|nr:2-phosphosulfolactate phosphatase [Rhodospirillales bacterium]